MSNQTPQKTHLNPSDQSDGNPLDITNCRRPFLSLPDLPFDMIDEVGSRLSLSGLHNFCQSSIGGFGSEAQSRLRGMFRRRLRDLDHVWKFMDLTCVKWNFGTKLPDGWHLAEPSASPSDSSENYTEQFSRTHGLMKYFRCSLAPDDTTLQEFSRSFSLSPVNLLRWRRLFFLRGLDKKAAGLIAHEFPQLLYLRMMGKSQAV